MTSDSQTGTLQRIQSALESARLALGRFTAGAIAAEHKAGHDPVTEADRLVDALLRKELLRDGEGWLSFPLRCNNKSPLISGLLACGAGWCEELSTR